jgi:hypothetical protein
LAQGGQLRNSYQLLARRAGIVAAALTGMIALVAPAMNLAYAQPTHPTTTTVIVSPGTTTPTGSPVVLTAVVSCPGAPVGEPTGTVNFFDTTTVTPVFLGSGTLGPAVAGTADTTLSPVTATFTSPPTTHTVTAVYAGDGVCLASAGTATVTTTSTTMTVTPSATQVIPGQPITFTAVVRCTGNGDPTGSVQFTDITTATPLNGPVTGTQTGTDQRTFTVTATLTAPPAGPHIISAVYTPTNPGCAASTATTTVNVATSTVTVTSPSPVTVGTPTTVSATVTCTEVGGSPVGGSVVFFDGMTVLGTVPVTTPSPATVTLPVTFTTTGTHTITASFTGTPTCSASSGTTSVLVNPAGTTIGGNIFRDVLITTPTTFLPGTHVFGSVTITGAGSLTAEGVIIAGRLTATGGTGLRLCGSSVGGATSISGMNGVIVIGDAGDDGAPVCAGNNLSGSVSLIGNTGFLEFSANNVGGSTTVNNNTTTILVPPENATATELENNHIAGSLSCSGNVPPPTNDGLLNTAFGGKFGQCVGL